MLKFVGRGAAFNVHEGNNAAYILEENKLFLIDCGSAVFSLLMKKEILSDVNEVFVAITHRHSDHVGSLGDLILYCFHKKNIKVNVYSADPLLVDLLGLMGIQNEQYAFCGSGHIDALGMDIRFILCSHACLYRQPDGTLSSTPVQGAENNFPCYSILFTYKGKKIFYSGDTNRVLWDELRDVDIYYVDTTISNYPGNAHYNIDLIHKDCCAVDPKLPSKIWCMHINSDSIVKRAGELGFHVVSVE